MRDDAPSQVATLATTLGVVCAAALAGCAGPAPAPAHSEAMLARRWEADLDGGRDVLLLGCADRIPDSVQQDVAKLERAVVELGLPFDRKAGTLECSRDGHGVLHQFDWLRKGGRSSLEHDPNPPTGIVIWPDWRHSDSYFRCPEASVGRWLSRNHVLISQWDASGRMQAVIDARNPSLRFEVPIGRNGECEWDSRLLSVTDGGMLVVVSESCGLWISRLDSSAPALPGQFHQLPEPICDALPIDERWIVVQTQGVSKEHPPKLLLVDATTGQVHSTIPGWVSGWCGHFTLSSCRLGDRSIICQTPQGQVIHTLAEDGTVTTIGWRSDMSVTDASPSGRVAKGIIPGWPSRFDLEATALMPQGCRAPSWPRDTWFNYLDIEGWLVW